MKSIRLAIGACLASLAVIHGTSAQEPERAATGAEHASETQIAQEAIDRAQAVLEQEAARVREEKDRSAAQKRAVQATGTESLSRAKVEELLERTREFEEKVRRMVQESDSVRALTSGELQAKLADVLARAADGFPDAQASAALAEVLQERGRSALAKSRGQGRELGAPSGLEERVRVLEQRLGLDETDAERSLEERVAELERRTGDRRPRAHALAPRPRSELGLSTATPGPAGPHAPMPPGLHTDSDHPGVPHLATPSAPRTSAGPMPPRRMPRLPEHLDAARLERATPSAPQPPPAPDTDVRRRWDPYETAGPSAPRRNLGPDMNPERRREIEDLMRRMRADMERLRDQMNQMRDELGAGKDLERLRGLGYVGEDRPKDR
jgi:hypothetical protein